MHFLRERWVVISSQGCAEARVSAVANLAPLGEQREHRPGVGEQIWGIVDPTASSAWNWTQQLVRLPALAAEDSVQVGYKKPVPRPTLWSDALVAEE